jgi:hypothetical protein
MPNRTEARPAKAALTNTTGRLPLLRLLDSTQRPQSNVQRVAVFGKVFSIKPKSRVGRTR